MLKHVQRRHVRAFTMTVANQNALIEGDELAQNKVLCAIHLIYTVTFTVAAGGTINALDLLRRITRIYLSDGRRTIWDLNGIDSWQQSEFMRQVNSLLFTQDATGWTANFTEAQHTKVFDIVIPFVLPQFAQFGDLRRVSNGFKSGELSIDWGADAAVGANYTTDAAGMHVEIEIENLYDGYNDGPAYYVSRVTSNDGTVQIPAGGKLVTLVATDEDQLNFQGTATRVDFERDAGGGMGSQLVVAHTPLDLCWEYSARKGRASLKQDPAHDFGLTPIYYPEEVASISDLPDMLGDAQLTLGAGVAGQRYVFWKLIGRNEDEVREVAAGLKAGTPQIQLSTIKPAVKGIAGAHFLPSRVKLTKM